MKKLRLTYKSVDKNKGSALISVVVAMLFVVALGTALLFTAYTGYRVKIVERENNKNFYDASTAMDEIKAGIQKSVNSALTDSYSSVLVNYVSYTDPDAEFKTQFLAELKKTEPFFELESDIAINIDQLAAMASNPQDASIKLTAGRVDNTALDQLTLKAVTLKYINKKGFETNISTDILVHCPDFYAGSTASAKLSSYAIVADTSLKSEGLGGTVTGGVFVGDRGVSVGLGSTLAITGGDLSCKGNIETAGSGNTAFIFGAGGNDLWARAIKAGQSSSINISANCLVENDLELNAKSKVSLSGSYLGFGESKTDAEKSSAIIVNSIATDEPASLDLKGLTNLTLAGLSFINPSSMTPIMMGQSMSVKSDQLAYLVPLESLLLPEGAVLLSKSNPLIYEGPALESIPVNTDTVLWKIGEAERKLGYYASATTQMIKNMSSGDDSIHMHFIFLKFRSVAKANEYFADYFTVYPDKITQYTDIYLKLNTAENTQSITAGNIFNNNSKPFTLEPAAVVKMGSAQTHFTNMSSPYEKFVDTEKITQTHEFKDGSTVLARVIDNGAEAYYLQTGETAKLIIATGNVVVENNYTGIIIAGGTVIVRANVMSSMLPEGVFTAENDAGNTMAQLGIIKDAVINELQGGGQEVERDNAWDPDKLVSYAKWKKF